MVPDMAMCTVMTSPDHKDTYAHTLSSLGHQHGVTQGNR